MWIAYLRYTAISSPLSREFNSTRMVGYGLSYQSLSSALDDKYRLDQIKTACENMAEGDVMEIKHRHIRLSDLPRRETNYGHHRHCCPLL